MDQNASAPTRSGGADVFLETKHSFFLESFSMRTIKA
jgi:hypothetical protein